MKHRFEHKTIFGLAFSGALALTVSGTFAATTPINPPVINSEQTVQQILDHYYSGDTVTRIDDSQDQSFNFDPFSASAKAIYAHFDQAFGYIPGASDGNPSADFVDVFNVSGSGYNATADSSGDNISPSSSLFRFARQGTPAQGSLLASSNPDDNMADGGKDHMVTYKIDDGSGSDVYALFFEDLIGGDYDYNDLVVQVTANGDPPPPSPAPTPTAALAGFAMLGAMAVRRRRRRRA